MSKIEGEWASLGILVCITIVTGSAIHSPLHIPVPVGQPKNLPKSDDLPDKNLQMEDPAPVVCEVPRSLASAARSDFNFQVVDPRMNVTTPAIDSLGRDEFQING